LILDTQRLDRSPSQRVPNLNEPIEVNFDSMWRDLEPVGRHKTTGGYRRYAWTAEDTLLGEWFGAEAAARGMDSTTDRAGNQWAWWGDPDAAAAAGRPGVVVGSHLDSVPDGGPFDGALGVMAAFAAIDLLRAEQSTIGRPIGVARFVDEEGARFGVACAGSRLLTGSLAPDLARSLSDQDGVSMAEAMSLAGVAAGSVGADREAMRRIGYFLELHIEQGRALIDTEHRVAVASSIWSHGRWRLEIQGEANHAGTTRLQDRHDPMLGLAEVTQAARRSADTHGCLATIGRVQVRPNAVNAIPSRVDAWLDARAPAEHEVRVVAAEVAAAGKTTAVEESFTPTTHFSSSLRDRIIKTLGDVPTLATGAGHDSGILAAAGIPTALLFVRNPTGVSHSPLEYAEREDCLAGIRALATVIADLASE
jgi:beta-ureidopropionase / N-carbamoyl-L-amino-acid hydrolase